MDASSWQARAEEHERWLARMRPMMDRMAVSILNHAERIRQNEETHQALITVLQEIRDRL